MTDDIDEKHNGDYGDIGPEPACRDCPHGRVERDPFGTGDRDYVEIEWMAKECPWGKE